MPLLVLLLLAGLCAASQPGQHEAASPAMSPVTAPAAGKECRFVIDTMTAADARDATSVSWRLRTSSAGVFARTEEKTVQKEARWRVDAVVNGPCAGTEVVVWSKEEVRIGGRRLTSAGSYKLILKSGEPGERRVVSFQTDMPMTASVKYHVAVPRLVTAVIDSFAITRTYESSGDRFKIEVAHEGSDTLVLDSRSNNRAGETLDVQLTTLLPATVRIYRYHEGSTSTDELYGDRGAYGGPTVISADGVPGHAQEEFGFSGLVGSSSGRLIFQIVPILYTSCIAPANLDFTSIAETIAPPVDEDHDKCPEKQKQYTRITGSIELEQIVRTSANGGISKSSNVGGSCFARVVVSVSSAAVFPFYSAPALDGKVARSEKAEATKEKLARGLVELEEKTKSDSAKDHLLLRIERTGVVSIAEPKPEWYNDDSKSSAEARSGFETVAGLLDTLWMIDNSETPARQVRPRTAEPVVFRVDGAEEPAACGNVDGASCPYVFTSSTSLPQLTRPAHKRGKAVRHYVYDAKHAYNEKGAPASGVPVRSKPRRYGVHVHRFSRTMVSVLDGSFLSSVQVQRLAAVGHLGGDLIVETFVRRQTVTSITHREKDTLVQGRIDGGLFISDADAALAPPETSESDMRFAETASASAVIFDLSASNTLGPKGRSVTMHAGVSASLEAFLDDGTDKLLAARATASFGALGVSYGFPLDIGVCDVTACRSEKGVDANDCALFCEPFKKGSSLGWFVDLPTIRNMVTVSGALPELAPIFGMAQIVEAMPRECEKYAASEKTKLRPKQWLWRPPTCYSAKAELKKDVCLVRYQTMAMLGFAPIVLRIEAGVELHASIGTDGLLHHDHLSLGIGGGASLHASLYGGVGLALREGVSFCFRQEEAAALLQNVEASMGVYGDLTIGQFDIDAAIHAPRKVARSVQPIPLCAGGAGVFSALAFEGGLEVDLPFYHSRTPLGRIGPLYSESSVAAFTTHCAKELNVDVSDGPQKAPPLRPLAVIAEVSAAGLCSSLRKVAAKKIAIDDAYEFSVPRAEGSDQAAETVSLAFRWVSDNGLRWMAGPSKSMLRDRAVGYPVTVAAQKLGLAASLTFFGRTGEPRFVRAFLEKLMEPGDGGNPSLLATLAGEFPVGTDYPLSFLHEWVTYRDRHKEAARRCAPGFSATPGFAKQENTGDRLDPVWLHLRGGDSTSGGPEWMATRPPIASAWQDLHQKPCRMGRWSKATSVAELSSKFVYAPLDAGCTPPDVAWTIEAKAPPEQLPLAALELLHYATNVAFKSNNALLDSLGCNCVGPSCSVPAVTRHAHFKDGARVGSEPAPCAALSYASVSSVCDTIRSSLSRA